MKKKIMKQLDVIFYYVTKLNRIEELLEKINENTKIAELSSMSRAYSGIVGEAGPELNLPKRYPVKDKYNHKIIAVFYNENAANEYANSCKNYYLN